MGRPSPEHVDASPLERLAVRVRRFLPESARLALLRNVGDLSAGIMPGDNPLLRRTFHESQRSALRAYRLSANAHPDATQASQIRRALELGYLAGPRRIQDLVRGRDVVDVGCGTGVHGIGYTVAGAKSYTGIDPYIRLDSDRAKNLRTRKYEAFGWTSRDVMDAFPQIDLVPGSFEGWSSSKQFDIAVLNNSTEHLMNIDGVFAGIAALLRPAGLLVFYHHSFFAWNGHHMAPRTVADIDPDDVTQRNYLDWAHIRFDPPEDHYFRRGLNKIRLDELRALVERDFEILRWDELPSSAQNGGNRLTDEIVAQYPELTRRDLEIQNVFCVAKRRFKRTQVVLVNLPRDLGHIVSNR